MATQKTDKNFYLTDDQAFNLIFKDLFDGEDPTNFTPKFKLEVYKVIDQIRYKEGN